MSASKTREDRSFYQAVYEEGEGPWSNLTELDRRTADWIEEVGDEAPSNLAVDLGTGRGRIAELFGSRGYTAVGLDYLSEPLRDARERSYSKSTSFAVADAFAPPLRPGSAGFLVDYGLLHHVRKSSWDAYRRNALALLEKGGYFLASVFHETDGHAGNRSRNWVYHRGHYDRFFTRETLDEFLGEGFRRLDADRIEDGEHTFLHALYRREESP